MTEQRRLAAILVADVVGYSKLSTGERGIQGRHIVNHPFTNRLAGLAAVLLVAFSLASNVGAQQKALREQLLGTWTYVSATPLPKLPDGSPVYGNNPIGLLILTDNGRYANHITRSDLPKFAAKSRLQGTADEYRAVVQGSIASFGTYAVNEAEKTITVHYEAATFPNLVGTKSTWSVTFAGDELKLSNTGYAGATGGIEFVYRRAK